MEEFTPEAPADRSAAEPGSRVESVSPNEIAEKVVSGEVLVIDLREPEEWREGHIPRAINIPYGRLESGADPRIGRDRPVYVNCATGRRSALATAILNDMGYERAFNLEGGIEAWEAAGYPVEGEEKEDSVSSGATRAEMELDLRGSICPGPTADTLAALKELPAGGRLAVISDYLPARQTIPSLVEQRGCSWEITEDDGKTFRIEIAKGGE